MDRAGIPIFVNSGGGGHLAHIFSGGTANGAEVERPVLQLSFARSPEAAAKLLVGAQWLPRRAPVLVLPEFYEEGKALIESEPCRALGSLGESFLSRAEVSRAQGPPLGPAPKWGSPQSGDVDKGHPRSSLPKVGIPGVCRF